MNKMLPRTTLILIVMLFFSNILSLQAEPLASNDEAIKSYGAAGPPLSIMIANIGSNCSDSAGQSRTGATAFTVTGQLLTCQGGKFEKQGSALRVQTTAQTVKDWCNQDGAMWQYDYVRYMSTCGGRLCQGLNDTYGTTFAFGLVTEIGLGFNYEQPYQSSPSTVVTVQCAQ